jgi:hypothetical protein
VERLTRKDGDTARTFIVQDGVHVRRHHQELGPAMRRTKLIQEANEEATRRGLNPSDRQYIGSVPMTVIISWLQERGYTMHDWAVNAGGTQCPIGMDPVAHAHTDNGVKSQFLRYFLSRDWCKLHSQHTTTKRGSSMISVPEVKGHVNKELRGAENSDS